MGHMEVPKLGVESGLQLPAYITASNVGSQLHLQPTLTAAHGNAGSLTR